MMVLVHSQNVYLCIVHNSPQGNLTRYEMDYEASGEDPISTGIHSQ